ncbi:hypothetical protein LRH25_16900 [Ideonella azotifigens]|uniref:Response regulatory domain-containing protein n=1 Tax=Ideonella azotifigens TaxID=513160 RepID=A0ABN1JIY4_9BURK|nr:hypothetical protein [Ideonella azotifigens]MCD2342020.1 hypothetical protein [Ideonella azotifigens]
MTAIDAASALTAIAHQPRDLILMDVQLPGMIEALLQSTPDAGALP